MKTIIKTIIKRSNSESNLFLKKGIVTFINPFGYTYIRKNPDLFKNFDYIFVDGMLLSYFISFFYKIPTVRTSFDMTGIAPKLFEYLNGTDKTIYFIGDTNENISQAIRIMKENYSKMNIIGYRHGFFKNQEEMDYCLSELIKLAPDYVVVGMGLYKQEEFLIKLKSNGWKGLGFTCGGFFHQINEKMEYYPEYINKYNLRWVYRFIKEPNVRWRLLRIIFLFPFMFIYDLIKKEA